MVFLKIKCPIYTCGRLGLSIVVTPQTPSIIHDVQSAKGGNISLNIRLHPCNVANKYYEVSAYTFSLPLLLFGSSQGSGHTTSPSLNAQK